uniref:Si:dkey-86e18.1 n=1 Tax=Cyclopterus lumpus TaxID=8103 RepID=A0A8C3G172_CYCLU
MARNAEKQQGKLNRLWLQKERDGERHDDYFESICCSTLNSAASLKKWIPSIKKEIEYYLQQSQLSHYPERKIAEFQLRMEALEREYKRFTTKLRVVDPACKHKPWTPRAYCKKSPGIGQKPPLGVQTLVPADPNSEAACADQDRPLTFDHARLAVAAAAFRGPPPPRGSAQTRSLARVLHSGLPNLSNAAARLTILGSAVAQKGAAEDREERTGHVLGLDCYSSSDEERDT